MDKLYRTDKFFERFAGDRSYLIPSEFAECGAAAAFTRRSGGVSRGRISGLNFGFRVGDDPESVLQNYRLLAADLGFDLTSAVCSRQTHTDNIRVVTRADGGKGIFQIDSDIADTDGLVTDEKGVALIIFTADCVPLLFYDRVRGVAAASHAGWRGTAKNIGGKTVRLMRERFGCRPSDIIAAVGPSIGPCCFEVDRATAESFDERYRTPKPGGKFHVDLWAANRDMIAAEGVENISVCGECTMCCADKYYSYRTHGEHTGRQAAVVCIGQ